MKDNFLKLWGLLLTLMIVIPGSTHIAAQSFCFYNPNQGPFYHNGSSGAIYDAVSQDFNSDGHLDIVTANSVAGNISFVPGYGDGTLGSPDTIPVLGTQLSLFCLSSGDFDGDGHFDIAVADGGAIFVLLGNGNGTFQQANVYPSANSPSRIYSRDINYDGNLDLIIAGEGVTTLIGQGNGTFGPPTLYLSGLNCNDVAIADFDGDAVLDMVSTTRLDVLNSELSFFKGNVNGTFAPITTIFSMTNPFQSIAGIVSGDVNNDGMKDLVVANSRNSISRVEVYTGNGNGTFNNPTFYPTLYSPFYIYLADFNKDQVQDIVVEESNGFSALKGNGNGTFDLYQHTSSMSSPNTLVIGDFNEDSLMDVLTPSAYFGSGLIALQLNCETVTPAADPSEKGLVDVYPNPWGDFTHVLWNTSLEGQLGELSIYNGLGQLVKEMEISSGKRVTVFRDGLPKGVYFLRLSSERELVWKEKLVLN